jgi:cholesterol transport system auxiliary component
VRFLFLAGVMILVAGCSSREAAPIRTYDLGVELPKTQLPALRAVTVRAPMPYDSVEMFYRLAWRDGAEISPFANSRWAAPPAELVRRQIVRALPGSAGGACALDVELHDFSQRFSAPEASEARIELRAALVTMERRVAAQTFRIAESGAGANAASGSGAFARAAERAVEELSGWIAKQPACTSP